QMKGNTTLIVSFILALLLLITLKATAQQQFRLNKTDSFNLAVVIDPNASISENGLNIGAEIEYNGTVYTRAGVTTFSKLKDGYTDIIGAFGIVFTSGYFEKTTYYSGIRLGVIIRKEANATAGLEGGIDHKITDSIILGIRGTYDYRSDWQFYGADNGTQYSTFLKLGYYW
ncbi:MAG TPA: hypothetical protein PLD18_14310, partial [Flavobacterium sp.]|nr:hypothetical protein [Flavobacterium sp.]